MASVAASLAIVTWFSSRAGTALSPRPRPPCCSAMSARSMRYSGTYPAIPSITGIRVPSLSLDPCYAGAYVSTAVRDVPKTCYSHSSGRSRLDYPATLTSCLPTFSPSNSPRKASGASSMPSATVSR